MRIRIEHSTTFTYSQPVIEAYSEMRLKPLDDSGQHCLSFHLTTEPRGETLAYHDRFGNDVRHFDLIQPHQRLMVSAVSEVLTPQDLLQPAAWLSPLDEYDYLAESHYTALTPEIRQFAAAHAIPGDAQATAFALMQAVYVAIKYEKGATEVTTTAAQALALRRGVCQDFSHILLAACRSQGLPARYVSGYLYNNGYSTATHAWVDVYLPGLGWRSLDSTHNKPQTDQYVRVAIGRDYADVPPTRGIFVGNAKESMAVSVQVTQL
jgi:transglutaminase-like putative cysteine protease